MKNNRKRFAIGWLGKAADRAVTKTLRGVLLLLMVLLVFACTDEVEESSPRVEESSPRVEESSPRAEESSPRAEESSPRAEESPPRAEAPAVESVPEQVVPELETLPTENVPEPTYFNLTYLATEGGSLVGPVEQEIEEGEDALEVTAVAADGFEFVGWSDGVTAVVRREQAVAENLTVTATFEPLIYAVTYRVEGSGSIEGAMSQKVGHGDDATPVTAVPASNHHFVGWSDDVTGAQRNDRALTGHLEVTARFAVDRYEINYIAGKNGRISGSATQHVNHGEDGQPVTAVAVEGHHFVRWSDGITTARRMEKSVKKNLSFTAEFEVNSYTVEYSAAVNGRLAGEASQQVAYGQSGSEVEAVADAGYHFVRWSDGVTSARRRDKDVRAELSVTAQFAVNTYSIGGTVRGLVEGTSLQIHNNDSEILGITANGEFRFAKELLDGAEYQVGVVSQPQEPNQICTVTGAAGAVGGADVNGIVIECVLQTYAVGGTVRGLPAQNQIVLQNKGQDRLTITADGPFVFPLTLDDGSSYEVEIVSPPRKTNWICDIHNPFGLVAGEDIDNVEVDCYPQVLLKAEAGIGKVRLGWNHSDFDGVAFDLCLSREEIGAGDFEGCRQLEGGAQRAGISEGLIIDDLRNNQVYWFQLLARYAGGRLTYSEPVTAVPYGGLNDTGIDWCADIARNQEMTGVRGDRLAACDALAEAYPGQDAMFGYDRKAMTRTLKKVGSGSAGFDFTKVCRSGETAGEGKCPPNPMPGPGFDHWACNRDNVTGLLWELKTESGMRATTNTYSWYQPDAATNGGDEGVENGGICQGSNCDTFAYVQAVNKEQLCGTTDWRVPSRQELLSIVDNGRFKPALDTRQFPDASSQYFWTSSPYEDNSQVAWQIYFLYGEALTTEKKQAKQIRLVSSESATFGKNDTADKVCHESIIRSSPDDVFELGAEGTATHKTTGLMWARCSLGQQWTDQGCTGEPALLTWQEALTASTNQEIAGFSDWRLPNKNELEFIVEDSCSLPAINRHVFPGTPALFYWTASPYAGSDLGAWSVDFGYGTVSATVKTGKLPVRLVRDVVW
ncbi:MAG: DUF1566 domain-containing protein [Pelovirga sp.]